MPKTRIDPGPFVVPMPTVLVGANVGGKANFMTAAFISIANFKPPIVACGLNPKHHTCVGIEETKIFSLNLPSPDQVAVTDYCGLNSGEKVDKSGLFATFTGELGVPMIEECRMTAECRLVKTVPFEIDTIYLGEVVGVFADEEALTDGALDWKKVEPMIFTFPDKAYWRLGKFVDRAWSIGKSYSPSDR